MSINKDADQDKEQIMNIAKVVKRARIRVLNDELRQTGHGGITQVTIGIAALGSQLPRILATVAAFEAFTPDNDPWGEHNCASLTIDDEKILWKIDYYDRSRSYLSPDPSDPGLTVRVLTMMLASEY